ncbi:MAG: glycosyltransferase [Bacteroidales bacterium]|jgi:glycosyltransferase involved in cell wall biosynthesis|nr:glycosyltransferase [Bacteroidales bacterium]
MKNLVLITSHFPFGTGESFLESELPFLERNFNRITIIALDATSPKTRIINEAITVYRFNPSTSFAGFMALPFLLFRNFRLITKTVKDEVRFRHSTDETFSAGKLMILLRKTIKAIQLRDFITHNIPRDYTEGSTVFYSYWLKTGAHAISMLEYPGIIRIARAHGSDLYEERTGVGYLPLLHHASEKLDSIFFISENGRSYFREKVRTRQPQLKVSYLGTLRPDETSCTEEDGDFVIVSCSNMIALKRIDLIIKALSLVKTSRKLQWLHFGEGAQKEELTNLAASCLSHLDYIRHRFMGYLPNNELLKFYSSNRVDLFINTSSSEGIPVSIIEAQSFGIPVIATDVGGVKEIVRSGTGSLLDPDFTPSDLAKIIEQYIVMERHKTGAIRSSAFENWKMNFKAEHNYGNFIESINSILAKAKGKDTN